MRHQSTSHSRQAGASNFEFLVLCLVIALSCIPGAQSVGGKLQRQYASFAQKLGGGSEDSMRDERGGYPDIDPTVECDVAGTC